MKRFLLPLLLTVLGPVAGVTAGVLLHKEQGRALPSSADNCNEVDGEHDTPKMAGLAKAPAPDLDLEYVKLDNQFIVPVVKAGSVTSMIVMSLSIEMERGHRDVVFAREPKLRDALLQAMFDHANIGGFEGAFTDAGTLDSLRTALTETAQNILGDVVQGVLILDIARQDI